MNCISVRAIIEYEGKFLLVRNKSFGSDHGFWCLPGGGLKTGEDVFSTLKREMVEEMNIVPEIGNLLYIHQIKTDVGYTAPGLFFHIKNAKDYLTYDVEHSTHGKEELAAIDWVDIAEVDVLPKFLKNELPEIIKQGFVVSTRVRLE